MACCLVSLVDSEVGCLSVWSPTSAELSGLAQTLARRIGCILERQDLLECDAENSDLAGNVLEVERIAELLGLSISYRLAVGPQPLAQSVYAADAAGVRWAL